MIERGDTISLEGAEVLSVKVKRGHYGHYHGITVNDPAFGKVWFKTTAKFSYELKAGDTISAGLEVSGTAEGIIFGKKPKKVDVVPGTDPCPHCGSHEYTCEAAGLDAQGFERWDEHCPNGCFDRPMYLTDVYN